MLVTLFTCKYPEMKWVAFVMWEGAFPSTAHYLPPHVSSRACLILPHLFDLHPPCCNFTPILLSIYPPMTLYFPSSSSFSTSPLLPMPEVVDGWITLEPGEAVPLIVRRGIIGPLVWLGPQIGNTRDESVQTAMRSRRHQWQSRGSKGRCIYIYIFRWREGKLYKGDSERVRGLKVTFGESDALQAVAFTTFTREI